MTDTEQEYIDDVTVGPTAQLWRRIPPRLNYTHHDHELGRLRPSSLAFDDDEDGTSAYLGDELTGPEEILVGHDGFGVAAITAEVVRKLGLKIVRDPISHPAHVLIYGSKSKSVKRQLAKTSTWIKPPDS